MDSHVGHTRVPSDSGTFRLNLVEFVFDRVFTGSRAPTRTSHVSLRIGLSILIRSPSFQFRADLVMDNPSGLQNELKDSIPVIVSDIVIPFTNS